MGVAVFGTDARAGLTTNAPFGVDDGHDLAFALFLVFIHKLKCVVDCL
jgi:hypothetical protein